MVRTCEMCPPGTCRPASFYCDADACYLCSICDQEVHSANRLAQRHIRRRLTPAESCASAAAEPLPSAQASRDVEILFEDVAEYDFSDFGSLDAKMPSLGLAEDDAMFASKSFSRGLASYLSWETMIPESIEQIVPDLEPLSPEPAAVDISPSSSSSSSSSPSTDMDDVVPAARHPLPSSPVSPALSAVTTPSPPPPPAPKRPAAAGRKAALKPDLVRSVEVEHHTPEQRKLLRMKALARFRSKRASRSFAKKVRYECRKQLADSRPRVKGRFVKKSEMALYRKYGALYRNHMHELATIEAEDHCVPTL